MKKKSNIKIPSVGNNQNIEAMTLNYQKSNTESVFLL